VIYSAAWEGKPLDLFTTRPESPQSQQIEPKGADVLAVSASGEMLLGLNSKPRDSSFLYGGTLARVPLVGGAPREILNDIEYADWSPDGKNIAIVHEVGGRKLLEFPMGKVLYEAEGWIGNPRVGPDGKSVAFVDHVQVGDDGGAVAVIDLAGKKTTLSGGWDSIQGLVWSPDGKEIWFTATRTGGDRSLYATTLAGSVRLLARVPGELTILDVGKENNVLMTRGNDRAGMIGLAPGEPKEKDLSWMDWSVPSCLSADGKTILFQESGDGGGPKYEVYLRNTEGSSALHLGGGLAAIDARYIQQAQRRKKLRDRGCRHERPDPAGSLSFAPSHRAVARESGGHDCSRRGGTGLRDGRFSSAKSRNAERASGRFVGRMHGGSLRIRRGIELQRAPASARDPGGRGSLSSGPQARDV
jgi:sugar lactone lactonase YvrE